LVAYCLNCDSTSLLPWIRGSMRNNPLWAVGIRESAVSAQRL
jgi:hypothetical protein